MWQCRRNDNATVIKTTTSSGHFSKDFPNTRLLSTGSCLTGPSLFWHAVSMRFICTTEPQRPIWDSSGGEPPWARASISVRCSVTSALNCRRRSSRMKALEQRECADGGAAGAPLQKARHRVHQHSVSWFGPPCSLGFDAVGRPGRVVPPLPSNMGEGSLQLGLPSGSWEGPPCFFLSVLTHGAKTPGVRAAQRIDEIVAPSGTGKARKGKECCGAPSFLEDSIADPLTINVEVENRKPRRCILCRFAEKKETIRENLLD